MEMYKIMQTFEAINVAGVRNTTVMFTGINQSGLFPFRAQKSQVGVAF